MKKFSLAFLAMATALAISPAALAGTTPCALGCQAGDDGYGYGSTPPAYPLDRCQMRLAAPRTPAQFHYQTVTTTN